MQLRYVTDVAVENCHANECRAAKAQAMAGIGAELAANVESRQVRAAAVPPPALVLLPHTPCNTHSQPLPDPKSRRN